MSFAYSGHRQLHTWSSWESRLSSMRPPGCSSHCSPFGVSTSWLRSRDRSFCDIALTASHETGELCTCTDGTSCAELHFAGILESACSGIRPARSSPFTVDIYTRAVHAVTPSDNHWPSLVSCCSCNRLEHIACPCPVITIYCHLSPVAKDIRVSTVISRPTSSSDVTNHACYIVDFEMARTILATLKICYWLIDWLTNSDTQPTVLR